MMDLRDLNEVEQRIAVSMYIRGEEPVIRGVSVEIPSMLMSMYRCYGCKKMRYCLVHRNDVRNLANTVSCYNCGKRAVMTLKGVGADNYSHLTEMSRSRPKSIMTIDEFFGEI